MHDKRLPAVSALALLLAACGGSSNGPGAPAGAAPSGFAYPPDGLDWLVGAAAPTQVPAGPLQGSDLVWSVTPALPAGLVLQGSGAIGGTPLAAAPETTYLVRAANDFGAAEAALTFQVHAAFDAALDVFTVHATEGRLARLRYDSALGRLRPAGSVASVPAPLAVAVDPLGTLALVGGVGEPALGLHRLDAQGRPLALEPLPGLPGVTALAMSPTGAFAVAGDLQTGVVAGVRLDSNSTLVGLSAPLAVVPGVTALAVAPGGARVAAAASGQSRVLLLASDPASGALGPELASAPVGSPQALAFSADGATLYVADAARGQVLELRADDLSLLRSMPVGGVPQELTLARGGAALAVGLAQPADVLELDLASWSLGSTTPLAGAPAALLSLGSGPDLDLLAACPADNRLLRLTDGPAGPAEFAHATLATPAALALRRGPRPIALASRGLLASLKGRNEVASFTNAGAPGAYGPQTQSFDVGVSPSGLASDPRRERVLALAELSGDLWQLGSQNGLPVGPLLRDLELTPDGEWLLIVGQGGLIALDADNPVLGTVVAAGDSPSALAVAPAGHLVYTGARGSDTVHGFELNPHTGALVELPWSPLAFEQDTEPRGLAISPDGALLAVSFGDANRIELFRLDGASAPAPLVTIDALWMPRSLAFTPDGRFLVHAEVKADLLVVHDVSDPSRPLQTASVPTLAGPFDLILSPDGAELSIAALEADALQCFELDLASGALFERGELPLGADASPAAVGHDLRWQELQAAP